MLKHEVNKKLNEPDLDTTLPPHCLILVISSKFSGLWSLVKGLAFHSED